jgi:hypothetical protein
MMQETNVAGVLLSPLLVYLAAAILLWLPVRWLFAHGLARWTANPLLAELAIFVCILGLLVRFV